jgi:ribonuclease VapC
VGPVTAQDAELAASARRPGTAPSLADRPCLATADRLDAVVRTADTAWGTAGRVRQVR